jgi:phage N-6-adenine-methyltransferase
MNTEAMFSSRYQKWETPPEVIADLATVFKWDWDVCASRPNICRNYYCKENGLDGLQMCWSGHLCWMNPPYGRQIPEWVERAYRQSCINGSTIVGLIPARTDTQWWHRSVIKADLIVFIKGRLTFGSDEYWQWLWDTPEIDGKPNKLYGKHGTKHSAPFPSAFAVWGWGLNRAQAYKLSSYGWPAWISCYLTAQLNEEYEKGCDCDACQLTRRARKAQGQSS